MSEKLLPKAKLRQNTPTKKRERAKETTSRRTPANKPKMAVHHLLTPPRVAHDLVSCDRISP